MGSATENTALTIVAVLNDIDTPPSCVQAGSLCRIGRSRRNRCNSPLTARSSTDAMTALYMMIRALTVYPLKNQLQLIWYNSQIRSVIDVFPARRRWSKIEKIAYTLIALA